MNGTAVSFYTLKRVQSMLGLSRAVVTGLVNAGYVSPARGPRGEHRFSFSDLMLLRTARALQGAQIPPRKIVRSLAQLRADLPAELPMSGLRITAAGSKVAVRDRDGAREADSGQLILDFEVALVGDSVTILETKPNAGSGAATGAGAIAGAAESPRAWLDKGESLEATDLAAAEDAYRHALKLDPDYVDAYLNLGALYCEASRCDEALVLYAEALQHSPDSALLHFNNAIALEDKGRLQEAAESYEACIALDPSMADAHFNVARLYEKMGDLQATLRHYNAYRRLQR